jgi:hypothetical protein
VQLESAAQLDRGPVHGLLAAAIARAGSALPGEGKTRTIVKSNAAKRSQRKAKKRSS